MKPSNFAILSLEQNAIVKFFIVVFSLMTVKFSAQTLYHPIHTLHEKAEIIYGLDNRYTHINDEFAIINGVYTGVGFGGKMKFKIGISGTPFAVVHQSRRSRISTINHLAFLTVGHEFDFFRLQKFSLTTYVQTGYGFNYFQIIGPPDNEFMNKGKVNFIPFELGLNLNYDFNTWLRAKIGYGHRFIFLDDSNQLNRQYAKATFTINIKNLWLALKKKDSITN